MTLIHFLLHSELNNFLNNYQEIRFLQKKLLLSHM